MIKIYEEMKARITIDETNQLDTLQSTKSDKMLLEGVDLAAKIASFLRKDPNFASRASEEIFDLMLDEIVLGVCFDIHKSIKTGESVVMQ